MLTPDRKPVPEISDAREALIQASIANDPDNSEITEAEFARMRPASEVLPPALYAKLVARGRPKAEVTKVPVKLRLDPDIVDTFKRTGDGWQTRMNTVLAKAARSLREGKSIPVLARASKVMAKKASSAKAAQVGQSAGARKASTAPKERTGG